MKPLKSILSIDIIFNEIVLQSEGRMTLLLQAGLDWCLLVIIVSSSPCRAVWWGENPGRGEVRWGSRRNWCSHDPGSSWSCCLTLPHTTHHNTSHQSPHHSLLSAPSTRQSLLWQSFTLNTPVLSLYSAATLNQSEASGIWLMVRPGYLTNESRDRIFSSGPVNSVIVLKC